MRLFPSHRRFTPGSPGSPEISRPWGISIVAWLHVARGYGKQSGTCIFQSGPYYLVTVRSNAIPDFRDITVEFVTIYLWALYCPEFCSWLAQANSLILPEVSDDSERREKTRWLEKTKVHAARTATPRASES